MTSTQRPLPKPSCRAILPDMNSIQSRHGSRHPGVAPPENPNRNEDRDPTPPGPAFDEYFMRQALQQAMRAYEDGETPTGCVIVAQPANPLGLPAAARVLGRAHNQTERLRDPTAHAEMVAITQAADALGDWRLTHTRLYVTKEPCAMCAGAIVLARIPVVVFGAADPNRGGISVFNILRHPSLNHQAETIGGILEPECRQLLQSFFKARRSDRCPPPVRDARGGAAQGVPLGSSCPDRNG